MKKLLGALVASVLVLGVGAGSAKATPINITVDAAGELLNMVGMADGSQYDPLVPPPPSNNPEDNFAFLTAMIARWNGVYNPDLPAAGALALDQGSLDGVTDYSGPAGYQYVVFHWGAGRAGQGGWWAAYYLDGSAISFGDVPEVDGKPVGGFSSARYFGTVDVPNVVPDGGAALMLLGGALVGLGALCRRFRA
jgi:hypothetical protein